MNRRDLSEYLLGYVRGYGDACQFLADAMAGDLDYDPRPGTSPDPTVPRGGTPSPSAGAPGPGPTTPGPSSDAGTHVSDAGVDTEPYIRLGMVHALRATANELRSQNLPNLAGDLDRRADAIEAAP